MRRFIAVTTKALTLTSSELLQSIPKPHNPLTCDNLNSSSNLCFGIPIGYFCLQPKCLYIFVSPCITHNICMCSFWVLYQMNTQYFLLCCMGVRGEQSLWMFWYTAQSRISAPMGHEVTEQSQQGDIQICTLYRIHYDDNEQCTLWLLH
jgi:hypothetical protein